MLTRPSLRQRKDRRIARIQVADGQDSPIAIQIKPQNS
jgi:hypothetical protein